MTQCTMLGVGICDVDQKWYYKEDYVEEDGSIRVRSICTCPYYSRWKDMLTRCYSKVFLNRGNITYLGCTVCEEWLTFSKFKSWMLTQEWEGKQLDKDLLVEGNRVYSPYTCVFLPQKLNLFLVNRKNGRGDYPIGVRNLKRTPPLTKPYSAQISLDAKYVHLGYFHTPEEAHKEWQIAKITKAISYAEDQVDCRISEALYKYVNHLQYDLDNNLITEF